MLDKEGQREREEMILKGERMCGYLRDPTLTLDKKFDGVCSLLDFHKCMFPCTVIYPKENNCFVYKKCIEMMTECAGLVDWKEYLFGNLQPHKYFDEWP